MRNTTHFRAQLTLSGFVRYCARACEGQGSCTVRFEIVWNHSTVCNFVWFRVIFLAFCCLYIYCATYPGATHAVWWALMISTALMPLMMAAATTRPTSTILNGRTIIPFGQGWRFHVGDSPDGPSYGSGALSSFVPRSACTHMVEHIEWTPGGNKAAGQPYTPCAIACRSVCRVGVCGNIGYISIGG